MAGPLSLLSCCDYILLFVSFYFCIKNLPVVVLFRWLFGFLFWFFPKISDNEPQFQTTLTCLIFPLHTLRRNHHHRHKVRRSFEYFLFIIKLLCSQQNENSFYTSFKVLTTNGVQFLVFNFLIVNIFVFCKKLVNIFYFLLSFLFSFNFLLLAITFWIISIFIHYNEAYNFILWT